MAKENTLIYRAQDGDEGAFADLMRSYHAYVYAIVIGIVKNSHDAEEVVQDTFLSAYQSLAQLEDSAKFKSWLAEIARNRARNWLRKQRGEVISIDEVGEHLLQTEDSPEERLTRQEQRELISRIMETLPQSSPEELAAQTDSTQDVEVQDNQPQIAAAESAAGTESIDDFFDQSEDTDTVQFATDEEFDLSTEQGFTTDISASSENTNQSAEDVMYAYLDAYRNSDFGIMDSLMTEQYRRSVHGDRGDGAWTSIEATRDDGSPVPPDEISTESLELAESIAGSVSELQSQAEVVSSEYIGDEFHFRLRMPAPEIPDISDSDKVIFVSPSYQLIKMQKENGTWRIYDSMFDFASAMSELSEVPR